MEESDSVPFALLYLENRVQRASAAACHSGGDFFAPTTLKCRPWESLQSVSVVLKRTTLLYTYITFAMTSTSRI